MTRQNVPLKQPARNGNGRTQKAERSGETPKQAEVKINPHLLAFGENFRGYASRELGIFADYVELKLDSSCKHFSILIQDGIDGLREVVVLLVDRAMKGIHCLRFKAQDLVVCLT